MWRFGEGAEGPRTFGVVLYDPVVVTDLPGASLLLDHSVGDRVGVGCDALQGADVQRRNCVGECSEDCLGIESADLAFKVGIPLLGGGLEHLAALEEAGFVAGQLVVVEVLGLLLQAPQPTVVLALLCAWPSKTLTHSSVAMSKAASCKFVSPSPRRRAQSWTSTSMEGWLRKAATAGTQ